MTPGCEFEPLDIDDAFEEFVRKCYPTVEETEVQYRETRRIFYSGLYVLLSHMTHNVTRLSDDEGVKEMQSIHEQCQEFFKNRVLNDKD